jgi:hypothetical protein
MIAAALAAREWAAIAAPTVALLIGALTFWINGERAERVRRRELYARCLAVAIAYAEMPFAIRRRRFEPDERAAERVRLSTLFSEIQAELAVCQALIDAEDDHAIAAAYRDLVTATRTIAGGAARDAWNDDPVDSDNAMTVPHVAKQLAPVRDEHTQFTAAMQ